VRFAVYLLRIAFARSSLLDAFERSIVTLIWLALALHLTGLLPGIVRWMSEIEFGVGTNSLSLLQLLGGAFWIVLTVLVALWAGAAAEARLMRASSLDSSLRAVFARLSKALLLVLAVLVVLPLIGVDLTVLSVFGGALGVGLQKIASNYLSGFIILLDRSIRLGDLITADGQHGQVTRITTRYVVVRSLTGIEAIIPNDTLVTTTVLNHSYSDKHVRLAVRVQVGYATDLNRAFAIMHSVARAHPRVLKSPEPGALLLEFADSGINLELGFWIQDPEAGSLGVRSELSIAILEEFRAQGIEIPYPRRDVMLLRGSSLPSPGNSASS
jgi:small-conductance mechanosensitive channel